MPLPCSLCRLPLFQCSCSHPFPSFSPFFLLLNVFVRIWNRDKGHFVKGLFFWETADFLLTSNPSSARLPSASSFAAWTWQVGDLSITASTKSCAFLISLLKSPLPSAYLPCDPSLPISVSPLLSFCFSLSEVFNTWEPEDPLQPLGPWVNDGPTNTPFCTLSYKDMDAIPYRGTFFLKRIVQSGSL